MSTSQPSQIRHYHVDEAGDGVLFNRKKQLVVGKEGCSSYFILGLLDVTDPNALSSDLVDLKNTLSNDPYLRTVPSMRPEAKKTALGFHAKDDCPEVRRDVFSLLMKHDLKFYAVVRTMPVIAKLVLDRNKSHPGYRYHPNQLYDRCVSRLFRDRLHKDDGYIIHFAKRGNRDRTDALKRSLERARDNFRRKWGVHASAPIEVKPTTPVKTPALQAADYFLWALQRLYERREDRYWQFVASSVSLVHDVDDTRNNDYGEYFTKRNALTLQTIQKQPGI